MEDTLVSNICCCCRCCCGLLRNNSSRDGDEYNHTEMVIWSKSKVLKSINLSNDARARVRLPSEETGSCAHADLHRQQLHFV